MSTPSVRMTQSEDGIAVAELDGELDLATTGPVTHRVLSELSNDALGLILDLSQVRYIDSTGVRMIFDIARRLSVGRRHLVLALPPESPLQRLFKVTHLAGIAPVCASVEDARRVMGGLLEAARP